MTRAKTDEALRSDGAPSDGMVPREEWQRTSVHQASRYSCSKCGEQFALPHEVYEHLDTVHAKPKGKR